MQLMHTSLVLIRPLMYQTGCPHVLVSLENKISSAFTSCLFYSHITNGWICDSNISCDDSNTIEFCHKFILKVGLQKIFQFQFIFGDLRALEFERVDGMFPTFSSYIFSVLLFSPSARNQPKTPHNDDKIQQLKDIEVFHNIYFILKTFRRQTYNPINYSL